MVGVGTGRELGTLEEQVQEVELSGGERRGALLCLCRTSPSVCLPLCESGGAVSGDLMSKAAL